MSLPPHPASAGFLPPHPSSLGGNPALWASAAPPPPLPAPGLQPPPPPLPAPSASSQVGSSSLTPLPEGGFGSLRGDKDPIHFSAPKAGYIIKLPDGDPLPRALIQHDLLHYIFASPLRVFTPPRSSELVIPPGLLHREGETEEEKGKLTFGELYLISQACSPRGTKSMRDKMLGDLEYGRDFAKLSLLVNVGKMNTTFAFYPEMRTILRTYHAVPSLQHNSNSRKFLQDAPRMKASLKGVLLEEEKGSIPYTLPEVIRRKNEGQVPPTSIVNLLFCFLSSDALLSQHFPPSLSFLDLFITAPHYIPSAQRAQAFLWLVYHYYESPPNSSFTSAPVNPFDDDHSRSSPGQVPTLSLGQKEQIEREENLETKEEAIYGEEMKVARVKHLEAVKEEKEEKKKRAAEGGVEPATKGKGGKKRKLPAGLSEHHQASASTSHQSSPSSLDADLDLDIPQFATFVDPRYPPPAPIPPPPSAKDELDEELDALTGISPVKSSSKGAGGKKKGSKKIEAAMDFGDDDDDNANATASGSGGGSASRAELEKVVGKVEEEKDELDELDELADVPAGGESSMAVFDGMEGVQIHERAPSTTFTSSALPFSSLAPPPATKRAHNKSTFSPLDLGDASTNSLIGLVSRTNSSAAAGGGGADASGGVDEEVDELDELDEGLMAAVDATEGSGAMEGEGGDGKAAKGKTMAREGERKSSRRKSAGTSKVWRGKTGVKAWEGSDSQDEEESESEEDQTDEEDLASHLRLPVASAADVPPKRKRREGPRETRLLQLAWLKVQSTMDDPTYDSDAEVALGSDLDSDEDEQAAKVSTLSTRISILHSLRTVWERPPQPTVAAIDDPTTNPRKRRRSEIAAGTEAHDGGVPAPAEGSAGMNSQAMTALQNLLN